MGRYTITPVCTHFLDMNDNMLIVLICDNSVMLLS